MSAAMHPANLLLRFALELAALYGMARYGWHAAQGWSRYAVCLLLPLLAASAWGTFAVPGDPSRSGAAPVVVRGWQRLLLEAAFFALGALAYARSAAALPAVALSVAAVLHYLTSLERTRWLLTR